MLIKSVSIELIPQLKDNYSYVIKDNLSNDIIIIDPAESELILEKIKNKKLNIKPKNKILNFSSPRMASAGKVVKKATGKTNVNMYLKITG